MRKTIKIGSKEIELRTSAAVPRQYRLKFRRDIFTDLNEIEKQIKKQEAMKEELLKKNPDAEIESELPVDTLTTFENIAFIMNRHADQNQPNNIDEWIEQFDTFDIYQIFPEILSMWNEETEQLSKSKKKNEE